MKFDDTSVRKLKIEAKQYFFRDPDKTGHYIRVLPTGKKAFVAVARDPFKKQVWFTLGKTDQLTIKKARELARDVIERIEKGLPPKEPPPVKKDSYQDVALNWLKRHVEAKKLITGYEIGRIVDTHLIPHWGERPFADIRRSDITALLDRIEDTNGKHVANSVLTIARGIASWQATRDDDYISPFVKGMARETTSRDRALTDSEIKIVWREAGKTADSYGGMVKLALLTGQRRGKIRFLRWSDIDDGLWTVHHDSDREKGSGEKLKLTALALSIIRSQPNVASNPYVFAGRGAVPRGGFSISHKALTDRCGFKNHWTFHDLRRTARTLMGRIGIEPHVAERVVGHVTGSKVERIYDQHKYDEPKAFALAKLSQMIESIIGDDTPKVVPILRKKVAH